MAERWRHELQRWSHFVLLRNHRFKTKAKQSFPRILGVLGLPNSQATETPQSLQLRGEVAVDSLGAQGKIQ